MPFSQAFIVVARGRGRRKSAPACRSHVADRAGAVGARLGRRGRRDVTLALSNPLGATLGDAAATGSLEDDDESLPPLTASLQGVPDEHDRTTFTFRVKLARTRT